jgi:hypothetical protein
MDFHLFSAASIKKSAQSGDDNLRLNKNLHNSDIEQMGQQQNIIWKFINIMLIFE